MALNKSKYCSSVHQLKLTFLDFCMFNNFFLPSLCPHYVAFIQKTYEIFILNIFLRVSDEVFLHYRISYVYFFLIKIFGFNSNMSCSFIPKYDTFLFIYRNLFMKHGKMLKKLNVSKEENKNRISKINFPFHTSRQTHVFLDQKVIL